MFRIAQSTGGAVSRLTASPSLNHARRRTMSGSSKHMQSPLEGDTGNLGTHLYHHITTALAVATPVVFLMPDSVTDGIVGKSFGLLLSGGVAAHSWIGLNYVCRDYVPKVSSALLGPARVVCAGVGALTFLGLAKISLMSPGGLKGAMKGMWNPQPERQFFTGGKRAAASEDNFVTAKNSKVFFSTY